MPTYDYHCNACEQDVEIFHKISDPAMTKCPSCHKETLRRKPGGGAGLSFKGSGWYKTDYNSAAPAEAGSTAPAAAPAACCPCGKNKPSCGS